MAPSEEVDLERRKLLKIAACTLGVCGVAAAVTPFIGALMPSKSTLAANEPIVVDISKLNLGEMLTVHWRGKHRRAGQCSSVWMACAGMSTFADAWPT